jgi:hypothetical protein
LKVKNKYFKILLDETIDFTRTASLVPKGKLATFTDVNINSLIFRMTLIKYQILLPNQKLLEMGY